MEISTILPENWEWLKLSDVITTVKGKKPKNLGSKNNQFSIPYINIEAFEKGIVTQYTDGFGVRYCQPNDILIVWDGARCGLVGWKANGAIGSTLAKLEFIKLIPSFVYYFLQSQYETINKNPRGIGIPHIDPNIFWNIVIPVPPIVEQERIVEKIEELFTQLDAGTVALKRVQAGLKRYKASVLKAAVEGRLVSQELTDEPAERLLRRLGKTPLERDNLTSLPNGWCWVDVKSLAADEPYSITDGPFGSNLKTVHYTDSGPRVIRLQNIGDGEFRDEKAHIGQEHFHSLRKHQVFAGDLVIAGLGEFLPRACIIPEYVGDAIVKADCIRFKPNANLAKTKYLLAALNSDPVRKLAGSIIHGVGRPRMNQQEIKSIPIPLPPFLEQERIIDELDCKISILQKIEVTVKESLARSTHIRQGILQQAFEGKLI